MRFVKLAIILSSLVLLNACVSTETLQAPPTINLSPEQMNFGSSDAGQQKDFGLSVQQNESDSLDNLAVLPGLRVRSVDRGSVAESAGLRSGDTILSANGVDTNDLDALTAILQAEGEDAIQIEARRGTTVYEAQLQKPSRTTSVDPVESYRIEPIKTRAGYRTEMVTDQNGQSYTVARVVKLYDDSPLRNAGITENDLIVSLNNASVTSAQQLVNSITQQTDFGEKVIFSVISPNDNDSINNLSTQTKDVTLWAPEKHVSKVQLWPLFTYESDTDPSSTRFVLLDLWVISLFSYDRHETEKTYSLFTIIKFGSDYGELIDASKE